MMMQQPVPARSKHRKSSGCHSARPRCITMLVMWVLTLAASLCMSSTASAQDPTSPLDIQVERLYSLRSESPLTLLVRLTPSGSGLLEGKLEFKLWNGRELLTTLTTDDEVINPPLKTVRYVLPAPDLHGYVQQLDLTVGFITKQGRLKKPLTFGIIVPLPSERDMVIGYVAPETMRLTNQLEQLLDGLKFEKYSPIPDDRSVRTITARISAEQLPSDAISNCAFNMLFIAAEGFSSVNESQWAAILEWVEAGGSLCVLPTDNLLPHHLAVLNQLLESKNPQGTFLLGPHNELLLKNEQQRQLSYNLRRGLGRVSVVPLLADEVLDQKSQTWRSTAAHLWRFRNDQVTGLVASGKWSPQVLSRQEELLKMQGQQHYYQNVRHQQRRLSYLPINSGDQLLQAIVPSNLHIIPLPLIAFVLFLYVLAIGPGDYFILGYFNLRKWTWVTFPLTTLVFAAGALFMAEWYMNTGDARRSVYFVDIGIEGRPERVNQFEMLFNSRQKVSETPLSRSLFTSLDHQMYGAGSYQQYTQQRYGAGSGFVGPAELTGRMPGRFVARQLTPKWVPQLNRILTLDTRPFAAKLDWQQFQMQDAPNWQLLQSDEAWKQSLIASIKSAFPASKLRIGVYSDGKYFHLYGDNRLFSPGTTNNSQYRSRNQYQAWNMNQFDFLADVSMLQDAGLFSVVTSIAPTGGRQLEDLSLIDPSDPRQWLLVVEFEDNQNWIVYRKLYAGIE